MKKLFTSLFLFISLFAHAQTGPTKTGFNLLKLDPAKFEAVTVGGDPNYVGIKSSVGSDSAFWGGIYGNLSDQNDLINALNLKFNITDTTGLWQPSGSYATTVQLNLKVDSVNRELDSVFYYANGIKFFAFIDSVGSIVIPNFVDSIYRTEGKDSIQFTIGGIYYAIKDSVGSTSGFVPTSRTLTINGLAQDLSVDRTWNVGTLIGGDTLSLSDRINLKVDSVERRSDSVFYYTSGTETFAFTDSVGGSGSVTNVTATLPLSSTGGTTPEISIPTASATTDGFLNKTDWSTFDSKLSGALTNGMFYVGNFSNVATSVFPSGDVTFNNTGAFTIGAVKVVNSMINDVAWSKISGTPTTIGGYGITDFNSLGDARWQLLSGKDATGGYAGLTLFKINFKNAANTFTSFLTNSNTAARTYTFKDADGTIAFTSDITGTNSGTNTGDQTFTASGDASAPGSTSNLALTLATVNSNVGSFGSATQSPQITLNGKGLATAATNVTITPAESNITFTDNTTNNVSTSAHGFVPKATGSTTNFLNANGTYSVPAGTGATTALDNLASVSINTSLLAQTGVDLGSTTKPFRDLYLFGGGTYGTNYFKFNGTPTSTQTITIPDVTGTVDVIDASQTLTNKTLTSSTNVLGDVTMTLGSDADGDIYYRSSNVLTRLAKNTTSHRYLQGGNSPSWAQVDLSDGGTGTLPYGNGGTGATSFTNHGVVTAGASALTTVAPGSNGNVLTSNGTDWVSSAAAGGSMAIGSAVTSGTAGSVLFVGTSSLLQQINSKFFFDSTNTRLGIGTATPAGNIDIVAGTLADTKTAFQISATQPTTITGTQYANNLQITGAGSSSQLNGAFNVDYLQGYTGNTTTTAGRFANALAGTAGDLSNSGGALGNRGVAGIANATTAGTNIGVSGAASGGTKSVGVAGIANTNKNSGTNIGVFGIGANAGTSPKLFGMYAMLGTAEPTYGNSAAFVCNNGSQAQDIFRAEDNSSAVVTIPDGGGIQNGVSGADLGSTTKPFHDLYLHGAGTYGTNYFKFTGTPTSTRTVTFPDATATVAMLSVNQTFTGTIGVSTSLNIGSGNNTSVNFRNTNAGSNVGSGFIFGSSGDNTAGNIAWAFDNSNTTSPFYLLAANGTRYISRASIQLAVGSNTAGAESAAGLDFYTKKANSAMDLKLRIDSVGNAKLGGTAARGTTEGTNQLVIFDGTAPAGTLTNGASFYSASGEMKVMDSGGTATQLSPHSNEINEIGARYWWFNSTDTKSNTKMVIDVEKLLKFINDKYGLDFVHQFQIVDGKEIPIDDCSK